MKRVPAFPATRLVRIAGRTTVGVLFCLILAIGQTAMGQTTATQPVLTWGRLYDNSGRTFFQFYQPQDVGNGETVVLADGEPVNDNNEPRFHLIKISALGDIVWDRSLGKSKEDRLNSLTRTKDGGFLLCGSRNSLEENVRFQHILLIKTDAQGNEQWEKIYYDGSGDEWGWFACERKGGGYLIFGDIPANAPNERYVAITDSSGTLLKENCFAGVKSLNDVSGSALYTYANGRPTKDGGCIVHTPTEVIKLSSLGSVEWKNDYSSIGYNPTIHDVNQTSDAGFALVVSKSLKKSDPNISLLKKLNLAGKETWSVNVSGDMGPNLSYGAYAVQETSDGGFMIGGTDGQRINGKRTIAKTDAAGKVLGSLFIPCPVDSGRYPNILIHSIVEQSPNRYIVAGEMETSEGLGFPYIVYRAYLARIDVVPRNGADPIAQNYH